RHFLFPGEKLFTCLSPRFRRYGLRQCNAGCCHVDESSCSMALNSRMDRFDFDNTHDGQLPSTTYRLPKQNHHSGPRGVTSMSKCSTSSRVPSFVYKAMAGSSP